MTTRANAVSLFSSLQLWWKRRILPGFGLTLGFTLVYLSLIVLIPLSAAFLKASGLGWEAFFRAVSSPRVIASYQVSFGTSLVAAAINVLFGVVVAWVLVRYRFPGKTNSGCDGRSPFCLADRCRWNFPRHDLRSERLVRSSDSGNDRN